MSSSFRSPKFDVDRLPLVLSSRVSTQSNIRIRGIYYSKHRQCHCRVLLCISTLTLSPLATDLFVHSFKMPTILTLESTKHSVIMEKLKESVIRLANSDPKNPLSSSQIAFLQHQLQSAFPVFQTPTHPTYSAMIQNAIKELNDEDGSDEESISVFIKENYEGLPWAHSMYLSHHLSKLCENGEIVYNSTTRCYSLAAWAGAQDGDLRRKQRKRRLVKKENEGVNEDKEGSSCGEKVVGEGGVLNVFQEEDIEEVGRNEDVEGKLSGEKVVEGSANFDGFEEEEDSEEIGMSKTKPRRRSLVFLEESDEVGGTAIDEGEQNFVAEGLSDELTCTCKGGGGDKGDAVKLILVPNECVEESHKDVKDSELDVKESGLKGADIPVQVKNQDQECSSKKKQPKRILSRKRKGAVIENEEEDSGEEEVLKVSGNLIGFQKEDAEEFGRSMTKIKSPRLVVHDENDEVWRTAIDGREQNLVAERQNEVLAQEDGDGDTVDAAKMMLVPAECVEDSPVTLIAPSVSNVSRGDNDPKLAGKKSGSKESELMIVPYGRNTTIVSAEKNLFYAKDRMIICGLPSIQEQKQLVCKNFPQKRSKACKQGKRKISLELISSSSASAGVLNVLEVDQKSSTHKFSPKKRLKSGQRKSEAYLEKMSSAPALAVDHNLLEHDRLQEPLSLRGLETKASEVESEKVPAWLVPMLNGQYFFSCPIHATHARSVCKLFCLDCIGDAFCLRCSHHHKDHRVVQIRMSSSYYFVQVDDIQRYLDISSIQTYSNNNARILFINRRSHLKSSKGTTRCESCCCGLSGSVRFCSLSCKLSVALSGSTNFKELPVDQSQQASTSSLLEDASINPETQKNIDLAGLSSLEDPMSVVEEDMPLQKVLEKCSKRKKLVEQKCIADAPFVTETSTRPISESSKQQIEGDQERQSQNDVKLDDVEALMEDKLTAGTPLATGTSSLLGLTSQVDQPISENSKQRIEDKERQSQNDVEAPMDTSVEGNVPTSCEECEQEPKQSLVDQPIAEISKQQIEDEERQIQNNIRFDDVEAPMDTSIEKILPSFYDKCEQEPKQTQLDQSISEISKQQNDVGLDDVELDVEAPMDTSIEGNVPLSGEKCEQEPKQSLVDQPISEISKHQNGVGLDDVEAPMDTSIEGNVPPSGEKCDQEPKQSMVDQPISEVSKQLTEEEERHGQYDAGLDDVEVPMDIFVEGNVPTSFINCEQEPKQSQLDQPVSEISEQLEDFGERESQSGVGLVDVEECMDTSSEGNVPTYYNKCEQEFKQSEATEDSVNLQCKKLKKVVEEKPKKIMDITKDDATQKPKRNSRGRLRKNVEATKEDVEISSNFPVDQQGLCDLETNQQSDQEMKLEIKRSRGRPPKHLKAAKNEASLSSDMQLQQQGESEEPIKKFVKERRGRPRKKQGVNKDDSAAELELAQKLEEKEHKADDSLDYSQSDAQGTVEGGRAQSPSDDDIQHATKNLNSDGADPSDQKQKVQECHEQEVEQGKLAAKGHTRPPKEKSGKSTPIHVPLSSKDHLRSRMKQQSQNSS